MCGVGQIVTVEMQQEGAAVQNPQGGQAQGQGQKKEEQVLPSKTNIRFTTPLEKYFEFSPPSGLPSTETLFPALVYALGMSNKGQYLGDRIKNDARLIQEMANLAWYFESRSYMGEDRITRKQRLSLVLRQYKQPILDPLEQEPFLKQIHRGHESINSLVTLAAKLHLCVGIIRQTREGGRNKARWNLEVIKPSDETYKMVYLFFHEKTGAYNREEGSYEWIGCRRKEGVDANAAFKKTRFGQKLHEFEKRYGPTRNAPGAEKFEKDFSTFVGMATTKIGLARGPEVKVPPIEPGNDNAQLAVMTKEEGESKIENRKKVLGQRYTEYEEEVVRASPAMKAIEELTQTVRRLENEKDDAKKEYDADNLKKQKANEDNQGSRHTKDTQAAFDLAAKKFTIATDKLKRAEADLQNANAELTKKNEDFAKSRPKVSPKVVNPGVSASARQPVVALRGLKRHSQVPLIIDGEHPFSRVPDMNALFYRSVTLNVAEQAYVVCLGAKPSYYTEKMRTIGLLLLLSTAIPLDDKRNYITQNVPDRDRDRAPKLFVHSVFPSLLYTKSLTLQGSAKANMFSSDDKKVLGERCSAIIDAASIILGMAGTTKVLKAALLTIIKFGTQFGAEYCEYYGISDIQWQVKRRGDGVVKMDVMKLTNTQLLAEFERILINLTAVWRVIASKLRGITEDNKKGAYPLLKIVYNSHSGGSELEGISQTTTIATLHAYRNSRIAAFVFFLSFDLCVFDNIFFFDIEI